MMANTPSLLLLKYGGLKAETLQLFKEMNSNREMQRLFFADPVMVLRTKLRSLSRVDISKQQSDLANRILFSLLSNDAFLSFMEDYQERKHQSLIRLNVDPKDKIAGKELQEDWLQMELAEAILAHGDRELVADMLGSVQVSAARGDPAILVSVAILIASIAIILSVQVLVQSALKSVVVIAVELTGTTVELLGSTNAILDTAVPASDIKRVIKGLISEAKRIRKEEDAAP